MAERIRVCHVITMLELGGAQQNTLYTAGHLDASRFAPSLLTGPGGLLDDEARALTGVDVQFVPALVRPVRPLADLRALGDLTRRLRALRPHIVHTHSSKAGILGRWAARRAGVPVIVHTIHGFGFHPGQNALTHRAFVAAEAAAARITTRFIAVSKANLDEGVRRGLFRPEKATVIRSGIALAPFLEVGRQRLAGRKASGALRSELGLGPNDPLAGMIGCLKPQKAPEDFVALAERVASVLPRARFVLAGDGELRGAVETAIRHRGLDGRVTLLGWRRDVAELLGDLDVLVLTSRWEGLPRVFPEAMASAVPVVAFRVDGAPEAIHDGIGGWLHDPGDLEGMARHVTELLADPARSRTMGAAGRERVSEWDIDEMVRRQESLYLELTGRQPADARPDQDRPGERPGDLASAPVESRA